MDKRSFPFTRLPREVRDMIYDLSLDYSGVQDCINMYNDVFSSAQDVRMHPELIEEYLQTPGLLLANRQIYQEARPRLDKKTLHITRPLLAAEMGCNLLRASSALISDPTLCKVKHVRFTFEIWNYGWASDRAIQSGLATSMEDDQADDFIMSNWVDWTAESALVESQPWASLLVHFLEIWSSGANRKLETLSIEIKRFCIDIEGQLRVQNTFYSVPTTAQEIRSFKSAVFDCYKNDVYFPLTDYLDQFKVNA